MTKSILGNLGTPRPLTFDLLAALEEAIYNASEEGTEPDTIVCSRATAKRYESLFEFRLHHQFSSPLGHRMWRNYLVIETKDFPDDQVMMLSTRHFGPDGRSRVCGSLVDIEVAK